MRAIEAALLTLAITGVAAVAVDVYETPITTFLTSFGYIRDFENWLVSLGL